MSRFVIILNLQLLRVFVMPGLEPVLTQEGRHLNDFDLTICCNLSDSSAACTEARSIGVTRLRKLNIKMKSEQEFT